MSRLLVLIASLLVSVAAFWLAFVSSQYAVAASNLAIVTSTHFEHSSRDAVTALLREQVARSPYNPELFSELANTLARSGNIEEAVSAMEAAVGLRRTWPYDWMALAELYAKARIYDERMTFALQNLNRFGSSERSLIYSKATFAMRYWYGFSEVQRDQLIPSVKTILDNKRAARRFAADLEKMNRTDLFCRRFSELVSYGAVSYTHLTLPTIYSV